MRLYCIPGSVWRVLWAPGVHHRSLGFQQDRAAGTDPGLVRGGVVHGGYDDRRGSGSVRAAPISPEVHRILTTERRWSGAGRTNSVVAAYGAHLRCGP